MNMQKIIILPGLGDHVDYVEWATRHWHFIGLQPIVHSMAWRNEESFETKLQRLSLLVDEHAGNSTDVSLIGLSAGGSAALNLFTARSATIKNAISICGRLRRGTPTGFRSFKERTKTSQAFAQSVECFELQEKSLTENQRKRIMTVHARFGDELVPAETAILEGSHNLTLPTVGHILTIYIALSLFPEPITDFLKDNQ